MAELISIVKWIGAPGSAGFFALCCTLGVVVWSAGRKGRRLAKVWMVLVCLAYIIGALPLVSYALVNRLPSYGPAWSPDAGTDVDILVVFSGDNPGGRARETRRVLDTITPRCVLVSGGPWFVRMVTAAGVDQHRLTVDDTAATTREQVAKLHSWANRCGASRVILVASTVSLPRIARLVPTSGLPVLLAPSPIDVEPARSGALKLVPSIGALRLSRDALYEHVAFAYYRRSNWLR